MKLVLLPKSNFAFLNDLTGTAELKIVQLFNGISIIPNPLNNYQNQFCFSRRFNGNSRTENSTII